jgi:hypothetical protein
MENWLPLLILLACPLMMLFMMRGMSHGHGSEHAPDHQTTSPGGDERDIRLADLEREVAELRTRPEHPPANPP